MNNIGSCSGFHTITLPQPNMESQLNPLEGTIVFETEVRKLGSSGIAEIGVSQTGVHLGALGIWRLARVRVLGLGFPRTGCPFGGTHNKDYGRVWSVLGPPI